MQGRVDHPRPPILTKDDPYLFGDGPDAFNTAFDQHWRDRGEDQTGRLWAVILLPIGGVLLFFGLMWGLTIVANGAMGAGS